MLQSNLKEVYEMVCVGKYSLNKTYTFLKYWTLKKASLKQKRGLYNL